MDAIWAGSNYTNSVTFHFIFNLQIYTVSVAVGRDSGNNCSNPLVFHSGLIRDGQALYKI